MVFAQRVQPHRFTEIMRIAVTLITILFFFSTTSAQSRTIRKRQYERAMQFAVSKTNAAYPVILTVTTNFIEEGKTVRTITDVDENQSLLHRRVKRTIVANERTMNTYQVSLGFSNVYCSDDGVSWTPSKSECWGPVSVYSPREPESSQYSVRVKSVRGKTIKIYREYSVFPLWEGSDKKEFRERVSTIDSRGFFKNVVDTEGTLNPRTVILKRKQSWVTRARIKPVTAPI